MSIFLGKVDSLEDWSRKYFFQPVKGTLFFKPGQKTAMIIQIIYMLSVSFGAE